MALSCGFFNSLNGDKKYNSVQMSQLFDGIIKDGVFDSIGQILATTPGEGMQVLVGTGRAWFNHTWTLNDAVIPLTIATADVTLGRYDAVVLEVDSSEAVRNNSIKVITGTPASTPVKPTMTNTETVVQHPLAYVFVAGGATSITGSNIQNVIGTSECPFVTALLQSVSIDALFGQWQGDFDAWFNNVQAQLEGNVVTNLQNQINQRIKPEDVPKLETLLSSDTKLLYNLPSDADPDDALQKILLGQGVGWIVTVIDDYGNPVSGATVSGVTHISGKTNITDNNGQVIATSTSATVTISAAPPWIDYATNSVTVTGTSTVNSVTITISKSTANFVAVTSSKSVKFSPYAHTANVCAVGGGSAGVQGLTSMVNTCCHGGQGGSTTNSLNIDITQYKDAVITIGNGGTVIQNSDSAGAGGTTTFSLTGSGVTVSAIGGNSSFWGAGASSTVNIFNNASLGRAGGGDGGTGDQNNPTNNPGGLPGGGRGGQIPLNGTTGLRMVTNAVAGYNGGGGGGAARATDWGGGNALAANGGSGRVLIKAGY